jgi:Caspase domain
MMGRTSRVFALLSVALWFVWSGEAVGDSGAARVALVVGNGDYAAEIGKLKNPTSDAQMVADTLTGLGFEVALVTDADQKGMKRAIREFGQKLRETGPQGIGLFYYAGHGVQVDGENFLLPIGAEIQAEGDVELEAVSASSILSQMQFAGNAVNLVFLDACRNNPLAKANRSGTRGLARLDAPRGSFVGYSTAPGDVAADGDGANSPYALALAEELKKPGISVEEAHRNVRAKVLAQSADKQTPWDSSSLTGAVGLAAKVAEPTPQPVAQAAPTQPQEASVDKEVVFWESIKGSADPADFEAYLAQYPQGTFVPLAKNKIAALKVPATPKPAPQPAATEPAGANASNAAPASQQIVVSAEIPEEIADYLQKADDSQRWSALAITADGSSVSSAFCNKHGVKIQICIDGIRNNPTTQAQTSKAALRACGSPGRCVLLYEGDRKVAAAEIVVRPQAEAEQPAAGGQAPSASGEQSQGSVLVTSDVMAQIDGYLKSATGKADKFNAFAIARDGTAAGHFTCSTSYCPGGSNSSRQEIANKQAINSCGGYGKCILLYEGDRNVASLTPVVQ